MKKSIRLIAVALVAVMLCMAMASCGKTLSGTYEHDATAMGSGVVTTYEFSGKKVNLKVETKLLGSVTGTVELEGKYTIEDDKITFEFETEKEDEAKEYNQTFDFKEGEDSITIGLFTYKKK